ncbi:MAG: type III restriction protein res subunit [Candidatus Berkelbacteria bacterium Athens1014_28]|uniref:Type III restriction protein res subunit n=1 Tax=Candidatus Berkelbacteria bacterium Athens1014_28 TaxID=2017145 RepID=A0A554LP79_9BACT|nr:MAG: type III restriction protein res subunit [Candidatus Berkelbacteria bacterium Athens1014_28]
MELRDYQEKKVEELKSKVNELLELGGNKICVLKAPTGSGKTIMMVEFMKRLVSPIDREDQSKKTIERNFEFDFRYSYFEDIRDNIINQNEILFLNWEKLYNKDRIYIRENEKGKNLSNIIENTKQTDREIILIIDESHLTALGPSAMRVREDIEAKITIEVSATPTFTENVVEVYHEKVVEEEMIKKEIWINPDLKKFNDGRRGGWQMAIDAAIEKRKELKKQFGEEKSDINPLLLIQLPNRNAGIIEVDEDIIQDYLKKKYAISEENNSLAVWLSENKTPNLVNIEKATNEVEVLIFKEAIAHGWDCPRAHILVKLRKESESENFEIQTVGRIMRMPELKHYSNHPELNIGFIYTNFNDISIVGNIANKYFGQQTSRRSEVYKKLDLPSIHFKRQREKTRLSSEFSTIFMEIADEMNLKGILDIKDKKIPNKMIVDGKIIDIDKVGKIEHSIMNYHSPAMELQTYYDLFCKANVGEFAPVDSMGIIKSALNRFAYKVMGFEKDDPEFHKVVLNKNNFEKIEEALTKTREKYKSIIAEKGEEREVENLVWNVPQVISYNSEYKVLPVQRSVMMPFYSKFQQNNQQALFDSETELNFVNYIDKAKYVKWWFKNGQNEVNYFAVPYIDRYGNQSAFYVDFILQLENNNVWLLDTKKGQTAEDAGPKAEGLAKYIKGQKDQGKKLFGGIVTPANGQWRYNDNEKYEYNPNDLKDWKFLNLN